MYILLDIIEYGMINSTSHQSWLFYSPLAKQAVLLKDDLLDPVDQLLEDPALVDLVQQCLAARSPASARTGRPGIPPDRVLRCCVMKHLKGWSFRDLERELRSNLVYRSSRSRSRKLQPFRCFMTQQRSTRSGGMPGRPVRAEAGERAARHCWTKSTKAGSSKS